MSDCLPFSLVKGLMSEARPPAMENQSHIVPVRVGDPVHCEAVTDSLLNRYQVYALPINDPTVPRGTERMRFTPTPVHSDSRSPISSPRSRSSGLPARSARASI